MHLNVLFSLIVAVVCTKYESRKFSESTNVYPFSEDDREIIQEAMKLKKPMECIAQFTCGSYIYESNQGLIIWPTIVAGTTIKMTCPYNDPSSFRLLTGHCILDENSNAVWAHDSPFAYCPNPPLFQAINESFGFEYHIPLNMSVLEFKEKTYRITQVLQVHFESPFTTGAPEAAILFNIAFYLLDNLKHTASIEDLQDTFDIAEKLLDNQLHEQFNGYKTYATRLLKELIEVGEMVAVSRGGTFQMSSRHGRISLVRRLLAGTDAVTSFKDNTTEVNINLPQGTENASRIVTLVLFELPPQLIPLIDTTKVNSSLEADIEHDSDFQGLLPVILPPPDYLGTTVDPPPLMPSLDGANNSSSQEAGLLPPFVLPELSPGLLLPPELTEEDQDSLLEPLPEGTNVPSALLRGDGPTSNFEDFPSGTLLPLKLKESDIDNRSDQLREEAWTSPMVNLPSDFMLPGDADNPKAEEEINELIKLMFVSVKQTGEGNTIIPEVRYTFTKKPLKENRRILKSRGICAVEPAHDGLKLPAYMSTHAEFEFCEKEEETDSSITCRCHGSGFMAAYRFISVERPIISDLDVFLGFPYVKELHISSHILRFISLCCLMITFISFATFRSLRKGSTTWILLHLTASLICLLIGLYISRFIGKSETGCIVANGLRYYFMMVSLIWNGVEGYNMFIKLIKVSKEVKKKGFKVKASLAAWGLPALSLGVMLAIDKMSLEGRYVDCQLRCMLPDHTLYFGYLIPMIVICVHNMAIFAKVLSVLRGYKKNLSVLTEGQIKVTTATWRQLMRSVTLLCLLGLPWIFSAFGAISMGADDKMKTLEAVFQVVFIVGINAQGIFIFLFHCARNREIRQRWKSALTGDTYVTNSQ